MGQLLVPLMKYFPCPYTVFFFAFIWALRIGVLNVITSIFVMYSMKRGDEDRKSVATAKVRALLLDADVDHDGKMSYEEFSKSIDHPILVEFFQCSDIDEETSFALFESLDKDGSGSCTIDEL